MEQHEEPVDLQVISKCPGSNKLWPAVLIKASVIFSTDSITPNIVIEWLALLLHVREVRGSNLGSKTGYRDLLSWFFSVPPGKRVIVP
jgi:hypothetical protein